MKDLTFKIPAIPPSYSKSLKINYSFRHTYLSKEARDFVNLVKRYIPHCTYTIDTLFSIDIEIHDNWYTKQGKVKRKDVQNLDRLLIDAIFNKIGIDDSHIFVERISKVHNPKESFTKVRLSIWKSNS